MKTAYLKGYYGYKNFGDEVLFFGIVSRIFSQYPTIETLYVEVQDATRMEHWVSQNAKGLLSEQEIHQIKFVENSHRKRIHHLQNMLGFGPYRKTFKFFGG